MSALSRFFGRFWQKTKKTARTADADLSVDRIADPDDPAVALAMRVLAEEGASVDDAALEAELAAAKQAFDAAPEEARADALARLSRATVRAAVAREARKKYQP